jgi:biotin transport system substrate-specific component
MLGAKRGALSTLIYVILGAAGLPVFAGLAGGLGVVLGPTGGFIVSFPILAYLIGLGADRGLKPMIAGFAAGNVINYAAGVLYFMAVTGRGLDAAVAACVIPFIPTAVIKAVAAGAIGLKIRSRVVSPA